MCGRKVYGFVAIVMLAITTMTSCSGGHVSQNGIFQDGHKELKASLEGSWRIIKTDGGLVGEELYRFEKKDKKVSLQVNGVDRKIERFDSNDGLSFTFEYMDDLKQKVFVVGQFRSSARKVLMLIEEPVEATAGGMHTSLTLEKRSSQSEAIVAKSGN